MRAKKRIRLTGPLLDAIISASALIEAGGDEDFIDSCGGATPEDKKRLAKEYANIMRAAEWAVQEKARREDSRKA